MRYSYCYDNPAKDAAARKFKTALRKVAVALGLPKDSYTLRFNPGGIAVWGEVTLHSDNLYIQASSGYDLGVLVRVCRGRQDYTGEGNNYIPVDTLLKYPGEFAAKVKAIIESPESKKYLQPSGESRV